MAKKGKILQTIIDISGEVSPTLGKSIDSVVDKLDGINIKSIAVAGAVAAIGTAAAAGVTKASKYLVNLGNEYDKAADNMAASTGLVGEELEAMEEVIKEIYGDNFGESLDDVAVSMSEVYRQTGLVEDELKAVTEAAFMLRDTFGYDIADSSRAAKAMMTNFGISGEEAMGLIAAGAQNGLDYSGELIDTINEYSVQFAKLGFTADEMFSVFQQGADSGAWNLDKVGDAVKEFSIRSIDGSDTTIHAFESLGLNAQGMMTIFSRGGQDAAISFQGVLAALMDMDDEVQRDLIGVELFGTQWEDLGTDAMNALLNMESGAYNAEDALGKIAAVKYDNLDSAMEGLKRQVEIALLPAAKEAQEAFMDVVPLLQKLLDKAEPVFAGIAEHIGPLIRATVDLAETGLEKVGEGIEWVKDNADWLVPIIGGLAAGFIAYEGALLATSITQGVTTAAQALHAAVLASGATAVNAATIATWAFNSAMSFLTSPITLIVGAVALLTAGVIWLYKNWDTASVKIEEFGAKVSEIWDGISSWIGNAIDTIGQYFPIFGGYLEGWWTSICDVVENIKGVFRGVVDFLGNAFAGNWSAAWGNIVDIFKNLFGGIVNLAKTPINAVVGAINGVIDGINGVGFTIPDWVPVVGGKNFSIDIPKIPMLASGGFTDGVSIAGEAGTEAVISFDPAYRSQNLSYWAEAGRMLGADVSGFSLSGNGSGDTYLDMGGVTFAPNITVHGEAKKETIMEAIEAEYPEFIDMLEEWFMKRRDPVYD